MDSGYQKIGRPKLRRSDDTRKDKKEKGNRENKHKTGERGECQLDEPTRNKEKAEEYTICRNYRRSLKM